MKTVKLKVVVKSEKYDDGSMYVQGQIVGEKTSGKISMSIGTGDPNQEAFEVGEAKEYSLELTEVEPTVEETVGQGNTNGHEENDKASSESHEGGEKEEGEIEEHF